MSTPLQTMDLMMQAWQDQDWDSVTKLFHADGRLQIVPIGATYKGHAAIREHLDEVAGGIESLHFEVHQLVAAGDIVTFERDDVFVYNGRTGRVPCAGVLEIEDGLVRVWREYFDGMSMAKALGMR